mmetsp:Transcript_14346/g.30672  ORF Transcript_14346/g.30672 Transcript_14346/m.30672 type:complete len:204 (+) Transcript_14346:141-752(+)
MKTSLTTLLIAAASALLLAAPTLVGAQLAAAPLRKDTRQRGAVQRRRQNKSASRPQQRSLEGIAVESNDHFIDVDLGLELSSDDGPLSMHESIEEMMSMTSKGATAAIVNSITTTTATKAAKGPISSEIISDAITTPSTSPTSKASKMLKPEPMLKESVTTPTIEEEGLRTSIVGSALSENSSSVNSPITILFALGSALTMLW